MNIQLSSGTQTKSCSQWASVKNRGSHKFISSRNNPNTNVFYYNERGHRVTYKVCKSFEEDTKNIKLIKKARGQ